MPLKYDTLNSRQIVKCTDCNLTWETDFPLEKIYHQCNGQPVASSASCCQQSNSNESCVPTRIQDCKEAGYERCVKCGHVFRPGESRQRTCSKPDSVREVIPMPPFLASAARYLKSYAAYLADGKRDLEFRDILGRFEICSSCPMYNDVHGQCSICGCYVNLLHDGQGANKLEWANEQCPHNPPHWNKQSN